MVGEWLFKNAMIYLVAVNSIYCIYAFQETSGTDQTFAIIMVLAAYLIGNVGMWLDRREHGK